MSLIKAAKASVFKAAWALGYKIERVAATPPPHYLELDNRYAPIIKAALPFTMTWYERLRVLIDATRYISQAKIPGAIVECGVWRGGSMMAAALTLLEANDIRDIYLFDTFAGMTKPTEHDVDASGVPAQIRYDASMAVDHNEWCFATLEDVRKNVLSTGYPEDRCHFVKGDVLDTIPYDGLGDIAILRLDTDWYESTLHELKWLYPMLKMSGILIVDDYGCWRGCKKAVDEYFGDAPPFFHAIDTEAVVAAKSR